MAKRFHRSEEVWGAKLEDDDMPQYAIDDLRAHDLHLRKIVVYDDEELAIRIEQLLNDRFPQ